jgi:hypothetical protein
MWRTRALLIAASCLATFGGGTAALAASGGDPNAGDVWTDNVGQPSGPGHEQDPHLACQDINLWGAGLADSSGTYTIDGWPPSGSQEVDYSGTWSYDTSKGGTQVVSVINVQQLISTAAANGDAPKNQNGYHFMLDFSQDPQKHKTFWVSCSPPSSSTTTTTTSGTQPTTTQPTSTTTTPETTSSSQTPTSTVSGTTLAGHHKKHKKHKKHVKPKRHKRVRHRKVLAASTTTPAFTG